ASAISVRTPRWRCGRVHRAGPPSQALSLNVRTPAATPTPRVMPSRLRRLGRAAAVQSCLLLFTLTLLEGGLQVASWRSLTVRRALAPPWIVNSPVVADAHLGWRGN